MKKLALPVLLGIALIQSHMALAQNGLVGGQGGPQAPAPLPQYEEIPAQGEEPVVTEPQEEPVPVPDVTTKPDGPISTTNDPCLACGMG